MLNNLQGVTLSTNAMSESAVERNTSEKSTTKTLPGFGLKFPNKQNMVTAKNYSDKNGNDVTKTVSKGRKTFMFWALVCLLFVLAIGNLILTFTILAVLRLGQGMESMEFLPDHNAIKFFGSADFDNIYKRDGVVEGFRDTPMVVSSENGSVNFNLQTRLSRSDTKLTINSSGIFARGISSLSLSHPDTHEQVFSTNSAAISLPEPVNNLNAKQVWTSRVSAPLSSDLSLRAEGALRLRGAEGTRLDAAQVTWSADQDVRLKSSNGAVLLSGREGVFVDVRYLPIALQVNKSSAAVSGQFKVCVCMPQGKLFRVHAASGDVTCASVYLNDGNNPCA